MKTNRISAEFITSLKPNEIFVFGSNDMGEHLGGAARIAATLFGAKFGQGVGLQGQSYAIPTLTFMNGRDKLSLDEINDHVRDFIKFALDNPQYNFLVTEIGCGIAGFKIEEIAPMFKDCLNMENVYLPQRFINYISNG